MQNEASLPFYHVCRAVVHFNFSFRENIFFNIFFIYFFHQSNFKSIQQFPTTIVATYRTSTSNLIDEKNEKNNDDEK